MLSKSLKGKIIDGKYVVYIKYAISLFLPAAAKSAQNIPVKIDLKRVYDSIDWSFLKLVLEGLGFPARFIRWEMVYISTPSYLFVLNGSLYGFIKGKRGLDKVIPYRIFFGDLP